MKTQNNTQETIKSQVSRTILRSSVVIFSVVIISLTVSAQDFWQQLRTNGTYDKLVTMIASKPSETEDADAAIEAINAEVSSKLNFSSASFVCKPEMENGLQVEPWMVDESLFISNTEFNTVEKEGELKIEDWMINSPNFSNTTVNESADQEKPLEIEPWMISEENFKPAEVTTEEPDLKIENWMLDSNKFYNNTHGQQVTTKPMQLESWMTDHQFWGF